jgi:vesicle coat complex subunit
MYSVVRLDDLKTQLDSSKDGQKLDAMKRLIGMIAKGRNVSSLFPAVVKNVVSKNAEIKKLVYVYLVRYAEEEQDLALLSISTFQKALKVGQISRCTPSCLERCLKHNSISLFTLIIYLFI